ncbi:MAG TPA: hypothetical protein VIM70_10400 [Clostridium sp.]|uniref:hypothetical protein n=1 Tax=Clostridium sp. TaxID=1506 RepID=UPI002F95E1D3
MKKSKIGWSLVLIFSTAALIGYGAWSLQYANRNGAFTVTPNNQGVTNSPLNRNGGQNENNYQNYGGMMNRYNGSNENFNNSGSNNFGGMMGGYGYQNGASSICQYPSHAANVWKVYY